MTECDDGTLVWSSRPLLLPSRSLSLLCFRVERENVLAASLGPLTLIVWKPQREASMAEFCQKSFLPTAGPILFKGSSINYVPISFAPSKGRVARYLRSLNILFSAATPLFRKDDVG